MTGELARDLTVLWLVLGALTVAILLGAILMAFGVLSLLKWWKG